MQRVVHAYSSLNSDVDTPASALDIIDSRCCIVNSPPLRQFCEISCPKDLMAVVLLLTESCALHQVSRSSVLARTYFPVSTLRGRRAKQVIEFLQERGNPTGSRLSCVNNLQQAPIKALRDPGR